MSAEGVTRENGINENYNDKPHRYPDNWYGGRGRYNANHRRKSGDAKQPYKRKWENVEDSKTVDRSEGDTKAEEKPHPQEREGYGSRFRRRGGQGTVYEIDFLNYRLSKTIGASSLEIPPQDFIEKKFNSRCKLFIGNIPVDTNEDEMKSLFAPYGDTAELYLNKQRGFGFIRLDYRSNAEKARKELDGYTLRNKNLRLRFSPMGSTLKVKNLTPYVTNELLTKAFSIFGEVERAMVTVDERGNSLKEGYVQFGRKSHAESALSYCSEGCFFLTGALKPVIVEPFEPEDSGDNDGFGEKYIVNRGRDFVEARETAPRFAKSGSFEFDFGFRWKQMHELYKQKEDSLKRERKLEEERLEAQLEYAKFEHETEILRKQLMEKEMGREKQKKEWEMRERQAEEQRVRVEDALRRHQEEISRRVLHHEEELRRRYQENSHSIFNGDPEGTAMDYVEAPHPAEPAYGRKRGGGWRVGERV